MQNMSEVLISSFLSEGQNYPKGMIELSYSDNAQNWGSTALELGSSAPVSMTAFNGSLWLTYRGQTSNTLYVSSSSHFENANTGQSTNLAPSVTVFKDQLWIAYIGETTGHVEVISSSDGTKWSQGHATGQSSKLPASITVFDNKLWIAFIGQDTGHIEVISSADGVHWSTSPATGQSSNLPPSLTVFQDQLWIAFVGQDTSHVKVMSSANPSNNNGWSKVTDTGLSTKLPISINTFQNQLWIGFVGEATGNVELINSGSGAIWSGSTTITTGEPNAGQGSLTGASLASVPAVPPVPDFGGSNQYVFASPQGDGWPANSNVTLPPIKNLAVYITITEDLKFDPSIPLSFQLNCAAPASGNWKIGMQQYVIMMTPNSTDVILHIQNFESAPPGQAYAGNTNLLNFPNLGVIPAGWRFQLVLQYKGDLVSGFTCSVFDENGHTVGRASLDSIGLPLPPNLDGNVDESWLAPIVAFQLVVVGYAEATHATLTSGSGYIYYDSSDPLLAGNTWAPAGTAGTAESSNCLYSVVPDVANTGLIQCFGAPPSA
jgi:hypothetical protein